MARPFNPYSSLRTEPDMRQEFQNTIDGSFPEIAKGRPLVHRKMRLTNNQLVQCPCVDILTKEPDKDTYCPSCLGEGYLWDETIVEGYKKVAQSELGLATRQELHGAGLTNLAYVSFYFWFDLDLTILPNRKTKDKIIEPFLEDSGKITRPYTRQAVYRIGSAIDFRADNGKLEYWRVDAREEFVKFLNGPRG